MQEKTGTVATVNWVGGEYYVNGNQISNSPAKIVSFTAPETGWGYFYIESSEPGAPDPWLPSWRKQGETGFLATLGMMAPFQIKTMEGEKYFYNIYNQQKEYKSLDRGNHALDQDELIFREPLLYPASIIQAAR